VLAEARNCGRVHPEKGTRRNAAGNADVVVWT
jgi:hypothetical protein